MPLTPIVTTCDEKYLPGLKALHNSFLQHSADGFEFWAVLQGSDELADHVRHDLGINVIHNLKFPADTIPDSDKFPGMDSTSYLRLMVPSLFPDVPKSIYIDTDSIILQNLNYLVDFYMGSRPVAATRSNSPQSFEFAGGKPGVFGPMSSLYVFNHAAWFKKRVLERCIDEMERGDVHFITLSQGLLQYVVGKDWCCLPWPTQAHAGHKTWDESPKSEIYTLHFMGTNPWDEFLHKRYETPSKMRARELWRSYA